MGGAPAGTVHVVAPDGIDDPRRPSGGNVYDRRVCTALSDAGWSVLEHQVAGSWPDPAPAATDALGRTLAAIPDDDVVLVDGLVGSAAADVVGEHARRLRVVVLVHLPLGVATPARRIAESGLLSAVTAVVTTSAWCRSWLVEHYALDPGRVRVAVPGTEPAEPAEGTAAGGALVCVGAVTTTKGHDVLVEALAQVVDLPWHCTCVGSLDIDPAFVAAVRDRIDGLGLAGRVRLDGPLVGTALDAAYGSADVLVLPSRMETYGMVVAEALARGMPVIATDTGGTAEALGHTPGGGVPGLLVPPADAAALAGAIRTWLVDPGLRTFLRDAASHRRPALPRWTDTAAVVAGMLARR